MKNTLKIDFAKEKIIMDRTFAQKCTNTASKEYAQLQSVRRDYPDFEVVLRKIQKNPNKESYHGLTYEYMEDYISTHEPAETRQSVLNEFEEMRLISACHSKAFRYPTIKKWFLNKYPQISTFGCTPAVEKEQEQEQKNNVLNMPTKNAEAQELAQASNM